MTGYGKLHPRVRMFIEQVVWVSGAYLAATGAIAIARGHATGPDWWVIPVFLFATATGAGTREIPSSIE